MTSPLRAQQVNAIYRFVGWYINITFTILDIIHRPVFYLKHGVSETQFCPRLQMVLTERPSLSLDRVGYKDYFFLLSTPE
jgi:hypothetical protein